MAEAIRRELKRIGVTLSKTALGIICIVFGVLFIVFPFPTCMDSRPLPPSWRNNRVDRSWKKSRRDPTKGDGN